MAHAQITPAKGKTTKQPKPAAPSFPTPDELRAFFFLLRELGWKPGCAHPLPPPDYVPPKGARLPTKAQIAAAYVLAREMGWMYVNEDEQALLKNLRFTTYKGRNLVYDTAAAMRWHRPWVDGSPLNTQE
jgi:hypothetical protein